MWVGSPSWMQSVRVECCVFVPLDLLRPCNTRESYAHIYLIAYFDETPVHSELLQRGTCKLNSASFNRRTLPR